MLLFLHLVWIEERGSSSSSPEEPRETVVYNRRLVPLQPQSIVQSLVHHWLGRTLMHLNKRIPKTIKYPLMSAVPNVVVVQVG